MWRESSSPINLSAAATTSMEHHSVWRVAGRVALGPGRDRECLGRPRSDLWLPWYQDRSVS